jgi:hypothetical protein
MVLPLVLGALPSLLGSLGKVFSDPKAGIRNAWRAKTVPVIAEARAALGLDYEETRAHLEKVFGESFADSTTAGRYGLIAAYGLAKATYPAIFEESYRPSIGARFGYYWRHRKLAILGAAAGIVVLPIGLLFLVRR